MLVRYLLGPSLLTFTWTLLDNQATASRPLSSVASKLCTNLYLSWPIEIHRNGYFLCFSAASIFYKMFTDQAYCDVIDEKNKLLWNCLFFLITKLRHYQWRCIWTMRLPHDHGIRFCPECLENPKTLKEELGKKLIKVTLPHFSLQVFWWRRETKPGSSRRLPEDLQVEGNTILKLYRDRSVHI